MARLSGKLKFTGRLGNLSAIQKKGSDEIILRTHGGACKKKIKTAKCFAKTRDLNSEWVGVTMATAAFRIGIHGIDCTQSYNYTSDLNSLFKSIQSTLPEKDYDFRPVLLSDNAFLAEGFHLNNPARLDTIIRTPLYGHIIREEQSASIDIPALIRGANFRPAGTYPLFRLIACLGKVTDIVYAAADKDYIPTYKDANTCKTVKTAWRPVSLDYPAETLRVEYEKKTAMGQGLNLVLSVGIEFGIPLTDQLIKSVKYAGAGKVIKLG